MLEKEEIKKLAKRKKLASILNFNGSSFYVTREKNKNKKKAKSYRIFCL